jgi:hypothetical protein
MRVNERVDNRLLLGKGERHEVTMNETAAAGQPILGEVVTSKAPNASDGTALKQLWPWITVIALAILLWAPRLSGPIDLRWDASVYYVLGTSLATGHGYRILSEPGSPEALQYPPLLPAVVALYQRALGSTAPAVVAPWLRISYAALFLAYALAVLALAKRYLRPIFALAATALCLLHHSTIFLSDALFAEIPFALISVVFVLVATGIGFALPRPWLREAASFVLAAAGFFLRTAGIALFAAWVIEALARRRWRLALVRVALALLPILLWHAYVGRVRTSEEYRHPAYTYQRAPYQFYNVSYTENALLVDPSRPDLGRARVGALAMRVARNFPFVLQAAGEAVSASAFYCRQTLFQVQQRLFRHQLIPAGIVIAPIFALLGLIAVGLVMLARRGAWLIVVYIIGSIGLICTTPWSFQFSRYVAPVAPFLTIAVVVAFSGIGAALRSLRSFHVVAVAARVALAGFLAFVLVVQAYTAWQVFQEREREGASFVPSVGAMGPHFFYYNLLWRGWEKAIAWIDQHSTPDAIVATPYSHLCYLRTGRHAVSPPMESDPARARYLLESVPVSYVIVDRGYSLAAIETDSPGWHLVQSFDGTKLYEHTAQTQ